MSEGYKERWCKYGAFGRGHHVPETDTRKEVVLSSGRKFTSYICNTCFETREEGRKKVVPVKC